MSPSGDQGHCEGVKYAWASRRTNTVTGVLRSAIAAHYILNTARTQRNRHQMGWIPQLTGNEAGELLF